MNDSVRPSPRPKRRYSFSAARKQFRLRHALVIGAVLFATAAWPQLNLLPVDATQEAALRRTCDRLTAGWTPAEVEEHLPECGEGAR